MVCKHRPATISDDVVWDYCDGEFWRRSFSLYFPFTLYFQYQKCTSCLLGADLAGCGNDDTNYGPLPWETVCPAVRIVRMGTSGKVRGMRDESRASGGGPPSRPPTPTSPNLHQSPSFSYFTCKLTSDPSNRVRDKALLQPLPAVRAMKYFSITHVPSKSLHCYWAILRENLEQTLTRLGHHPKPEHYHYHIRRPQDGEVHFRTFPFVSPHYH